MKQVSIKRMSTRFGLKCEYDIYSRFKEASARHIIYIYLESAHQDESIGI